MPTYEYECKACEHRFEIFQSIKASPLKKCPECKKMKLRRLIGSGAGIIFKGSGFYETDYKRSRTGAGSGKNGKDTEPKSESSSSSESSSKKSESSGDSKKE